MKQTVRASQSLMSYALNLAKLPGSPRYVQDYVSVLEKALPTAWSAVSKVGKQQRTREAVAALMACSR